MAITHAALLVGGAKGWHTGAGTVRYSFLGQALPDYYPVNNTNDRFVILDDDNPITVSFDATGFALNANDKALIGTSIKAWNDVGRINLKQGIIPGQTLGEITLGGFKFGQADTFGFVSDLAGTLGTPSNHGDFWINYSNTTQLSSKLGNSGWQTFLHEFGHALGLHHPNDDGDNAEGHQNHNNQYTVMSYVAHPSQAARAEAQQAWPITPMLFDIQAIQKLYGPNLTTRAGNTTYFGPAVPGSTETAYPLLDGGKLPNGIAAILTIWDGRGIDTINASNQTQAVRINLNPGQFSKIGPFDNNVGLAAAVTVGGVIVNLIENATGGRGNDFLTGNVGANVLNGGLGADRMVGLTGNDSYVVDNVADVVTEVANGGTDQVSAQRSYTLTAGSSVETLKTINAAATTAINLTGNALTNTLIGNAGANVLNGVLGNDTLNGGGGLDTLNGGGGRDVLTGGVGGDDIPVQYAVECRHQCRSDCRFHPRPGRDRLGAEHLHHAWRARRSGRQRVCGWHSRGHQDAAHHLQRRERSTELRPGRKRCSCCDSIRLTDAQPQPQQR